MNSTTIQTFFFFKEPSQLSSVCKTALTVLEWELCEVFVFFTSLFPGAYNRAWPGPQKIIPEQRICGTDTNLAKTCKIAMLGRCGETQQSGFGRELNAEFSPTGLGKVNRDLQGKDWEIIGLSVLEKWKLTPEETAKRVEKWGCCCQGGGLGSIVRGGTAEDRYYLTGLQCSKQIS